MKPSELFTLDPDTYRFYSSELARSYNYSPETFTQSLLEAIPEMDPKTLRMTLQALHSKGIQPFQSLTEAPDFLYRLEAVPSESMLVLLKNDFPTEFNGRSFLSHSLDRAVGPDLRWFAYLLDLSDDLEIDLNRGLLHDAIASGSLPQVELLLSHQVDPNRKNREGRTPLSLAIDLFNRPGTSGNYQVYLETVKSLVTYGATVTQDIRDTIPSSWSRKLDRAIEAGRRSSPDWVPSRDTYFDLDNVEEKSLVALTHPERIRNVLLADAVDDERATIVIASQRGENVLLTWPFYIDGSRKKNCEEDLDVIDPVPTASSPPTIEQVYEHALRGIPEYKPTPIASSPGRILQEAPTSLPSQVATYPLEAPTPHTTAVPVYAL